MICHAEALRHEGGGLEGPPHKCSSCHRGVNAWAEGRQGEVGRGSSPPKNPFFSPFPAL
jgi:hypothetical protein